MNTEDIIVMVIFYVFAFYALMLFIMSIRRGEILFEQGKGTRVSDGASFIRWLIYHGTIIGILLLVLFGATYSDVVSHRSSNEEVQVKFDENPESKSQTTKPSD
jgi:hypothetical protein